VSAVPAAYQDHEFILEVTDTLRAC